MNGLIDENVARNSIKKHLEKLKGFKPNIEAEDKPLELDLPFISPMKNIAELGVKGVSGALGYGKDYKDEFSNVKNDDDLRSAVNNAISRYDSSKPIFSDDKKKGEFLGKIGDVIRANKLGDGLIVDNDTNTMYIERGDDLIDLDDGILKHIARIGRDNLGSIIGGALAVKGGKSFLSNVARGAVGSGLGGGVDGIINSNATEQNINLKDLAQKVVEEAGFSAGGDLAFKALGKSAKPALNAGKWVLTHTPTGKVAGLAGDVLKSVPTANASGAEKVSKAIAGDERDLILKGAEKDGLSVDSGGYTDIQAFNPVINKIKDFSSYLAEKLHLDDVSKKIQESGGVDKIREDILNTALSDRKESARLIDALRQDSSGNGARKLQEIAHDDISKIKQALRLDEGDKNALSTIVENYYNNTKGNFGRAIDELADFVENRGGAKTVTLSDKAIDDMIDDVTSRLNEFDKSSDKTQEIINAFENLRGKELGVKDLNKLRSDYNKGLNDILNKDKVTQATKIDFARGKEILEQAMDELLADGDAIKYLKDNLKNYKDMKHISGNKFFETVINKDSSMEDIVNAFEGAYKSQGKIYDDFINRLSDEEAERFESALLKHYIDGATGISGTYNKKEALDSIALSEVLEKMNFKSERAKAIKEQIDKLAKTRGNVIDILQALENTYIKPKLFNKGIATTFEGASKTATVNAIRAKAQKYIPYMGDDSAFYYHLAEGLKHAKAKDNGFSDYIESLKRTNAPKETIKTLQDVLNDAKELAEVGNNIEPIIKGDGFTMQNGVLEYKNTLFDVPKNVREKAKINDTPIQTNLDKLREKHPNVFKTQGDVARLIYAIKNNPTHFLDGSNEDNAILLKKLKDNKTGYIGIQRNKEDVNLIVHALRSSNKKEIKRLIKRQMDRASLPITSNNGTGTGAKAHSSAKRIIPQKNQEGKEVRNITKILADSLADITENDLTDFERNLARKSVAMRKFLLDKAKQRKLSKGAITQLAKDLGIENKEKETK
ncbi:hypothetical protein BB381_06800 [Campylobacter pinnipediorum subsp. caledonicus]|uniref:hypothetical protein n=1 Tax=Campylobacter pinnipediorum TaxID=1965231 RepID=UPI000994B2DB|nr:hypothetical protein [Campylobacter pinnipediorum]AQW85557.1 hypothetical protein CPIN18020_0316 [Campylobacter pinnipediorum subsp. caledonicus]OPA71840.1 hypothetical protein BB381_06800 [Campylobacter pinnipediorum subsp. caledonicus]